MCYSAQIHADYRKYQRLFGATLDLHQFVQTFWERRHEPEARVRIPQAVEAAILADPDPGLDEARHLIRTHRQAEATRLEQTLFAQRKRLADADRQLAGRPTRTASESRRIAGDKVERALRALADLRRLDTLPRDARIFPGWWAPVMVEEDGQRLVRLMRYQCRPAGKPPDHDRRYPGTYNARRDNLRGFWRGQFGHSHGVVLVEAFYENVERTGPDGAPGHAVLEFRPRDGRLMNVACLWSRWQVSGQAELLSFAAITDEPPPEVAAAGHDRCLIPLRDAAVEPWLHADARHLAAAEALLDDRERPYYEHRLAA